MTLSSDTDLDGVEANQHTKYLGLRLRSLKVIVWTDTNTQTHIGLTDPAVPNEVIVKATIIVSVHLARVQDIN